MVVVVDLASSFFLLFISYFHWGCYPYKLKSQMTVYQAESSNLCFGRIPPSVEDRLDQEKPEADESVRRLLQWS